MDKVITICYNKKDIWESRQEAINFFFEGVVSCEGSEQERYLHVLMKLQMGCKVCDDN